MKAVILDGDTMGSDIDFSPVFKVCDTTVYPLSTPEEVPERIKDADIIITNKVLLSGEILKGAKQLKLICVFAVGFNNIDIEYCRAHSIKVRNVPGYCTQSVCQHTFALLFILMENMRYYDDFVKSGKYSRGSTANHIGMPFHEIAGLKWGIIGMGAIGREVAKVATAFGASVSYASTSGAERKEDYPLISLETLIKESDIISIHAPLNEKTLHLIGEKELSMMKKTAFLVNVGRGAVIDEAALKKAIDQKWIAGAAIDVYTAEPPEATSSIMTIENTDSIVFTPHIAWASTEARARCVSMTADNIKAFTDGKALHDVW